MVRKVRAIKPNGEDVYQPTEEELAAQAAEQAAEKEKAKKRAITKIILIALAALLTAVLCVVAFLLIKPLTEYITYDTPETLNMNSWMAAIDDDTLISDIVIPGTHDSGTYQCVLSYFTRCQQFSFTDQMSAGFRLFDVRLDAATSELPLTHGGFACMDNDGTALTFADIVDEAKSFLSDHPSETIIFMVKQESGDESIEEMQALINAYFEENPDLWYIDNTIPTMGQARGKIVFMPRYYANNKGIDVYWDDQGGTDDTTLAYETTDYNTYAICVQDRYKYNAEDKWTAFTAAIPEADKPTIVLDYLSITGESIPHPFAQAAVLLPKLMALDSTEIPHAWISVDFGSEGVAELIVRANF